MNVWYDSDKEEQKVMATSDVNVVTLCIFFIAMRV